MTYNHKPNTGSLWPNDKKVSEHHPDIKGDVAIDKRLLLDLIATGEDPIKMSISAWKNVSQKTGTEYWSLKISEPFIPVKQPEQTQPKQAAINDIPDEDVPF